MNRNRLATYAMALIAFGGFAWAQTGAPVGDEKKFKPVEKADAKSDKSRPATHKVEKKPFKIELNIKAGLEPAEATEIVFRPQATPGGPFGPAPLTVRSAIEHGSKVRAGDVLIALNTERIDQMIKDLETDLKVTEASIKLSEEELSLLKKTVPLDLTMAERTSKQAGENLKYFLETGRPEAETNANFFFRAATFFLEFEKEQLRQLEKMYKANDLTEETEQLILKRQRFWVEWATLEVKQAEVRRDFVLKTDLPRREAVLKEAVARETILLEKARKTLTPLLKQKEQALVKIHHERDKTSKRLQELQKDRQAMTILSPKGGIVYYGRFNKGQWEGASAAANKLTPHTNISPGEVLMSVVAPRPLTLRVQIEEKDAFLVRPGLQGKAQMVFNPDVKLPVNVTKISPVPASPGKFEAVASVDAPSAGIDLMPGMACSVKFVPYSQKQAIVVPAGSVFEEDDKYFVTVVDKDGKHEKREVQQGRSNDGQVEILSGLREGEEILLEKPGDKKKSPVPEKGAAP